MKSLSEVKRERLQSFYSFGSVITETEVLLAVESYILETIDLMNARTAEVVEEVIGQNDDTVIKGVIVKQNMMLSRNDLREEQRHRAKTLLGGEEK